MPLLPAHTRTPARRRSLRRTALRAAVLAAAAALAGCRSDSLTSSEPVLCADRPGCVADVGAPVATQSVIVAALDDAATRIAPSLADAQSRSQLLPALGTLRADLLAGRAGDGRQSLAMAYAAVQSAEARAQGGSDAVELAAIRLSLVPAADALGVAAR